MDCQKPEATPGHNTKYCRACSTRRNEERQERARSKRQLTGTKAPGRIDSAERRQIAAELSHRRGPVWMAEGPPELVWTVGVAVPFTWAFSKNHIYSLTRQGHVHLRDEHRTARDELTARLQAALRRSGVTVVTHKLWIDILVEKASHRGDAVNVIDGVCDAVKKAVKLDDRWYCIRRLDWEVVPDRGKIYVAIGQEELADSQVCSYCGRILALTSFTANRSQVNGVSRTCRDCSSITRQVRLSRQNTEAQIRGSLGQSLVEGQE